VDDEITVSHAQTLTGDRREALKSIAGQLLELREMLKTGPGGESARHLRR
jgi:hypothetical protein